jgi:hypothetical protein
MECMELLPPDISLEYWSMNTDALRCSFPGRGGFALGDPGAPKEWAAEAGAAPLALAFVVGEENSPAALSSLSREASWWLGGRVAFFGRRMSSVAMRTLLGLFFAAPLPPLLCLSYALHSISRARLKSSKKS